MRGSLLSIPCFMAYNMEAVFTGGAILSSQAPHGKFVGIPNWDVGENG